MLTLSQAIILGLIQGVTELFPISSLGHSVIAPALLGWNINQNADFFLAFLVATHLATSLALLAFFWSDWVLIIKGFFKSLARRQISETDTYGRLAWLIIVGTIPAGLVGLILEKKLTALFAVPLSAAIFLILNGLLLFGAEILKKRAVATQKTEPVNPATIPGSGLDNTATLEHDIVLRDNRRDTNAGDESDKRASRLSWWQATKIGLAQCLALIPGFSRTGATLGGGLAVGLDHEASARFAFLLATPIIFAAALLKLPELGSAPHADLVATLVGALAAALGAFFSVKFLTGYFKTKTLTPFAIYCVLAGALSVIILLAR